MRFRRRFFRGMLPGGSGSQFSPPQPSDDRRPPQHDHFAAQNDILVQHGDAALTAGDFPEALKCYRQAAGRGNVAAMSNLGGMHGMGLGTTKDYDEANKWFMKAALAGHPDAMFNLGVSYLRGRGLAQDHGNALRCFREAAAGGSKAAQDRFAPWALADQRGTSS